MPTINRSALLLRPREPYLRWAASIDASAARHAETLRGCGSVYLVPPDASGRAEAAPLKGYFEAVFEAELDAWCPERSLWPASRDLATFRAWFEVEARPLVVDLCDNALDHDD